MNNLLYLRRWFAPAPLLKPFIIAAIILSLAPMFGQSTWAGNNERKHDLNIVEVFVTLDDPAYGVDTITISGEDFDFGRAQTVHLGSFPDPLVILDATATQIVAECPTTIAGTTCPAGDYLLRVSTGKGKRKNDEWDLTMEDWDPRVNRGRKAYKANLAPWDHRGDGGTADFIEVSGDGIGRAGGDGGFGEPGFPSGVAGGAGGSPRQGTIDLDPGFVAGGAGGNGEVIDCENPNSCVSPDIVIAAGQGQSGSPGSAIIVY